jgi:hypothetical protein
MEDETLYQRGLRKRIEQNVQSDIIQGENRADFIEEEAAPESSTGIIQRLLNIGNELQDIVENVDDPEEKRTYFEEVALILDELTVQIQQMVDMFSSQGDEPLVSEMVMEFVQMVDKQYLAASELFLSAIQLYYNFMETEDETFIGEALERVETGSLRLEQGQIGAKQMRDLVTGLGREIKEA